MKKLGRAARERLALYRDLVDRFDEQTARLVATSRKLTPGGMVSVRGHVRKGRAVHSYARRLSPSTRSAYRHSTKSLGRRLYRVETRGLDEDLAATFRRSLAEMPSTSRMWASAQLHRKIEPLLKGGKQHWFTRKGWKRFGIPAYRSMYQSVGVETWARWKPKIRTSRGGVLVDPWQALR